MVNRGTCGLSACIRRTSEGLPAARQDAAGGANDSVDDVRVVAGDERLVSQPTALTITSDSWL
jgi:hypothetical protein